MAYELRDGQGSLFRNDKEGNDKRPDYRGQINIGGTFYDVSGWIKEGKKGKWMSLKVQLPHSSNSIHEAPKSDADERPPF
jgi:uncharacterized protein (DUF736 family)